MIACSVEAAGRCPGPAAPGRRVPRWQAEPPHRSPCHQHLAVGQQGCRVIYASVWRPPVASRSRWPGRRVPRSQVAAAVYPIPLPPAPFRWVARSPWEKRRAVLRLPVTVQVPLAGSYSSALEELCQRLRPPATSTLPLGSKVAVWHSVRC